MEEEDRRFREELRREVEEADADELDGLVLRLSEESKHRQRAIFRAFWDDGPRAA
jgi:hypothetical protein